MTYSERLFEPFWRCPWGVYAFSLDLELDDEHELLRPNIPQGLVAMLEGALRYPPAIALTRESIYREELKDISKEGFCNFLEVRLEEVLKKSVTSGFFMAKARAVNCLRPGSYYWLVGYNSRAGQVQFVTEEFHVLEAPAADFELDLSEIRSLQDF